MLNKLTIRKQSDLNNLIKVVSHFIDEGGEIASIGYDKYKNEPRIEGRLNNEFVQFRLEEIEDYDDIVVYSELDMTIISRFML